MDTIPSRLQWQRGERPPEEILGRGTEPGLPRGWVASSPPAGPTQKPGLLFDLASCTLFSLQSRELILLPLSQAISTHIIPRGLPLARFSRNLGRVTEGAQLLGTIPSQPPFEQPQLRTPGIVGSWFADLAG